MSSHLTRLGLAMALGSPCLLAANVESAPKSVNVKQPAKANWWRASVEVALTQSQANRPELEQALARVPVGQREGLQFLLENMPAADLRSLSAKFLLEHVALKYQAFEQAPWKKSVSRTLFFNDVLPYYSLTETRDESSKVMREKAAPFVAGCKTPSEAAMRLNEKLFPLVNVRYSTERKRPDQSALESMESGKASCSGLSILLVDACRTVGIPARVVGTPMWSNMRGNHTWVEIWDNGWQFLGACEPDPKGLNQGWFIGDAAQAKADVPQHAIYASSFKKTGLSFPMVWARSDESVNAVNVTTRYAPKQLAASEKVRVLLKVLNPQGKRIAGQVTVRDAVLHTVVFSGTSRDESADTNDFLSVSLPRKARYQVTVGEYKQEFDTGEGAEQLVSLVLEKPLPLWAIQPAYVPPKAQVLPSQTVVQLKKVLRGYFVAATEEQAKWKFPASLEELLRDNEATVRQLAWEVYREAPLHVDSQQDFRANQARFHKHLSPYTVKQVGTKPANGWGLVIAMHGGGGVPKAVNNSQWEGMQSHYKDHPEFGGYQYVALRAPNDTWNGFYDTYTYPLIANLIRQFTLHGEVDPNKVFLIGYSHGGYGAFAIGPKMPDRFAAIHASAAAGTDGETTGKTLRNTVFSTMVGEFDNAYDRRERVLRFDKEIVALRANRTDIYPVRVDVMAGFQHGNLKDGDKLAEMLPAVRNPVPRELTWLMTDEVINDFFWLQTKSPAKEREIDVVCKDNRVIVTTTKVVEADVLLDSRLIDFKRPIQLEVNGRSREVKVTPNLRTLCETLAQRGDPELAFTARVSLPLK